MKVVDKVRELAAKKSCTPGQLALAWVHAQGPDVFPIPGTKRVKYLEVRSQPVGGSRAFDTLTESIVNLQCRAYNMESGFEQILAHLSCLSKRHDMP